MQKHASLQKRAGILQLLKGFFTRNSDSGALLKKQLATALNDNARLTSELNTAQDLNTKYEAATNLARQALEASAKKYQQTEQLAQYLANKYQLADMNLMKSDAAKRAWMMGTGVAAASTVPAYLLGRNKGRRNTYVG